MFGKQYPIQESRNCGREIGPDYQKLTSLEHPCRRFGGFSQMEIIL